MKSISAPSNTSSALIRARPGMIEAGASDRGGADRLDLKRQLVVLLKSTPNSAPPSARVLCSSLADEISYLQHRDGP